MKLILSHIAADHLRDTEKGIFGKNDPFLRVKWGGQVQETSVRHDAGKKCSWDGELVELQFESLSDLKTALVIEVVNENESDKNKAENVLIGSVELPLESLKSLAQAQFNVELTFDSGKGKPKHAGNLALQIERFENSSEDVQPPVKGLATPASTEPASRLTSSPSDMTAITMDPSISSSEAKIVPETGSSSAEPDLQQVSSSGISTAALMISSMSANGLRGTEKGLIGKNDPYLRLKWREQSQQTSVKRDAGKKCTWAKETLKFHFDLASVLPESSTLLIEVLNDNVNDKKSSEDVLIGSAEVSFASLLSQTYTEHCIPLIHSEAGKEKFAGNVCITTIQHSDHPLLESSKSPGDSAPSESVASAEHGLVQVPREESSVGDVVTSSRVSAPESDVRVKSTGVPADAASMLPNSAPATSASASAAARILILSKMAADKLRGTEKGLLGKNDPYLRVTWQGKSYQTSAKRDAGRSCTWEGDLIELQFHSLAELQAALCIEVVNENVSDKNSVADVIIGSAELSIESLSSQHQAEFQIDLMHSQGGRSRFAGRVSMSARWEEKVEKHPPEPSAQQTATSSVAVLNSEVDECSAAVSGTTSTLASSPAVPLGADIDARESSQITTRALPESKLQEGLNGGLGNSLSAVSATNEAGMLLLSGMTASKLRGTEKGFLGKNDPYLRIWWHGQSKQTSVQHNAGKKCAWEGEVIKLQLESRSVLKTELIIIEVVNENASDKKSADDVVIGAAELSLAALTGTEGALPFYVELKYGGHGASPKCAGYVTLTAQYDTGSSKRESTAPATQNLPLPGNLASEMDPSQMDIELSNIHASGLRDTETGLLGKNDPFVRFIWGSVEEETGTISNGGKKCSWDSASVRFSLSEASPISSPITVEVWNDNSIDSKVTENVLIGSGTASMDGISMSEPLALEVKLRYGSSDSLRAAGVLWCNAKIVPKLVPVSTPPLAIKSEILASSSSEVETKPESASELVGTLVVCRLEAHDMPETESFLLGGKQDPYCKLSFAGSSRSTSVHDNAGKDCSWVDERIVFTNIASGGIATDKQLDIEVWNKNPYKDDLIGTCVLLGEDLVKLVLASARAGGAPEAVRLELARPKKRSEGFISLSIAFESVARSAVNSAKQGDSRAKRDQAAGSFIFSKLQATDLPETELGGKVLGVNKQDPYLTFKFSASQHEPLRTSAKAGAGKNATWDGETISLDHDGLGPLEDVELECWNENPVKDTFIAKGTITAAQLCGAGLAAGVPRTIEVHLHSKNDRSNAGVAILCVTFAPAVAGPGSAAIPECKAGYLRLFQLTYADAAGRGRSGAGRRQLVVILGEEKDVTSKGIKSEDEWEGQVLNLRADADRSGIRSDWQAGLWLEVRSGTRLLGKSNLDLREIQGLLRCPAAPKVFELKLSRDGTDFCGSVSFKARFDPDDWTAPLATDSLHNDDIVRQEDQVPVVLLLSRISASELANTERFGFGGLNKQDPYVVASIGDTKAKTRALGGAGVDACWEGEELKLTISAKDASSGQLNLAIWNENLGSDALIGDGRVPLSDLALWTQESGGCQTKPKNISLQLTTAKGEKKGKISMQARCYAVADERAEADESVIRKLTVLEEMEGPGRTICRVLDAALERPLQNPSVTISFQPGSRSASTAPLFDSQMSTKETSHPVWEQQLLLPCYMMNYEAMGVDARLVVRISERSGLLGRAKVAGSGMLDVSEILQVREARKLAMNIYSDSDKRQPLGVINLELRFVGSWEVDDAKLGGELSAALDASDTDVPSPDVLSGADLPLCSPGNVRVHVLEAKELRVTEKDQDPYVVLDRKEGSFKTSVHKDAGSDAKWFESGDLRFNLSESHAAVGNPDSSAAVFRLQVKVMDHDDLSGDDLIADADLLVTRETLTTKQSSIGWHKLSYQGSDAGWIRLAFEWVPDPPVQIAVSTLRPEERVEEGTLFLVVESARELNGPNFMGRALDSPPSLEIELRPYEKHGRKMSKIAEARDGILEGVAIWQRFLKMNFVPVPRSVDKALADTPPTLILKVSCPIALGAKQSLGRAELPLAAIAKSDLVAEWQPVRKTLHLLSDDRSAGLLDVYTLYVPKALIEDKQAIAAVKRMRQDAEATLDMPRRSSPVEPPVPGYLDVHVIRGSSLHKVEKSQDPYVELKLICTTGAGTFCTPVAQDSADQPEWNSHFSILVDDASVETLDLWVKDGDNIGGRTSTIGRCKIPLRRFAAMSSVHDDDILQISPETFQLTDEKGKEFRGNVMLALHFRHEDDSLPARIMNCVCPGRSIQGSVQATIVSLGDLPNPPFSPSTGLHVEGCLTDCRQPESCLRTVKVGLETDSSGHLEIPWFSCGGDCRACDSPHISFNVYASGSSNSVYSSGNIPVDACLLGPNQNFHRVVQLRSTREGDISRSSTAFLQVILKFLPGSAPSSGSHSPVEKSEIDVAPGHLVVHCLRARNLPTVQQIGKQDPYLELIVQDNLHGPQNTVARTDPHTNGGRHPSWNQLHTLAIDDATSTRLLVRVLDDNSGTPMGDKLIGELQLSTAGLLNALQTAAAERQENGNDSNKMQMEGWFPIRKDHLSTGGEVRLCLEWLPRDFLLARSLVTGDELGESGPMGPYRYKLERKPGRLLVTVHRVVGLSKPILGQRSSVVEAVLKMPGSVGTKTRTQQQIGLNPDFEEQLAVDLLWTPQHTSCPEFALHVIDPGMGGGVLATGTLDLAPFILHPRMPADISCPLKGVESGAAVFCSVAYIPAASGRMSGAGIDPDLAQLAFAAYSGSVHVEVLSADGLPAGTKSPLATVRLRCANGPDSRSEWQDCICTDPKMGNTSPSFDKSLLFPISRGSVDKPGSGATPVLEIEICEGNANRKSHIGRIELPLLPLWLGLGHMTRTWYPISPKGRLYLGVQYISAGALSDSEPLAIVSSEPVILADVRQCNLIEAHASDLRCELEIVGTGSSATTGVAKEGAWSGQEGSLRLPLRGSGQQAATIMRITLLGQQKSRLGLSKGSNCIIGQCDWPISLSAVEGHRVEAQHTLFSGDKPTAEVLLGCRLDPNNEFKSNPVTAFAAPSLTGKYCISILKVSGSALGTSNLIWQAATACSTDPSFETELLLGNSQIAAVPASSIKGIDSEPAAVILRFYESQPANLVGTASISAEILQSLVLEKGHGSSEKHEQWLGVTLVDSAALNKGHIDKVLVDIAYCHSAVGVLEVTALEAQIVATALETDHMDMKRTRLRACCQLPPSAIWGNDPVNMRCSPLSYVHPVGPSDPVVNNPVIPSYDDGRSVLHSVCWAGYTPHRLRFFNSVAMCIPITLSMHVTPEGADISQAVCECAVPLDVLIEKLYAEVISESRQKLRKRRVLNEASPLVGSLDCDFSSIFEAWYPLSMVTSRSAPSETIGRARVAVRFAPHPATLEEDWVNDTPQSSWAEGAMAMKSLFYRIDRDGSGTIDSSELSACLKAAILEESASADLYGPGQGGAIDIRKLGGHSLAESGLRAAGKLLLGLSSSMGLSDNEDGDDDHIAALFQAMDTDLSGEISFTEYERFVTEAFSRISEAEKKGYVNQLIPDNADDPDPEPFAEEYEEALDVALGKKGEAKAISTEAPLAAPSNQLSFDRAAKAVDANIEAPKARLDLEEDLPTSAADEKQTTRPDSTLCTVLESQIPRQHLSAAPKSQMPKPPPNLPPNIKNWRTPHVVLWLERQAMLPQYGPAFTEAGVDGLVLLAVDDRILEQDLGVESKLHRLKICQHVAELKRSQDRLEMKENRDERDMGDLRRKVHTPTGRSRRRRTTARETSDDWHGQSPAPLENMDRVKLERMLRQRRREQLSEAQETDRRLQLWRYAYDGSPKPGSKVLTSASGREEILSKVRDDAQLAATGGPWPRKLPSNATSYEVLAVLKAAMSELGDVLLLETEEARLQRCDSDLGRTSCSDSGSSCDEGEGHLATSTPRMTLLYNAFVDLQNNGARWLGQSGKLTRLKLEGGISALLGLEMSWEQFDLMFNSLDSGKDGCLSCEEFTRAFGNSNDLAKLQQSNRANAEHYIEGSLPCKRNPNGAWMLDDKAREHEFDGLKEAVLSVAHTLAQTDFSLTQIFNSFDRNGSGRISVAEFTSLMKLLVVPDGERGIRGLSKRQTFLILMHIDESGDRLLDLGELSAFFYTTWSQRLKIVRTSLELRPNDKKLRAELRILRSSLRLNFSRKYRDTMSAKGGEFQDTGPFSSLLARMGINEEVLAVDGLNSSDGRKLLLGGTKQRGTLRKAGRNELLRYRLRCSQEPRRVGATLCMPRAISVLEDTKLSTVENDDALLKRGLWYTVPSRVSKDPLEHASDDEDGDMPPPYTTFPFTL